MPDVEGVHFNEGEPKSDLDAIALAGVLAAARQAERFGVKTDAIVCVLDLPDRGMFCASFDSEPADQQAYVTRVLAVLLDQVIGACKMLGIPLAIVDVPGGPLTLATTKHEPDATMNVGRPPDLTL